MTNMSMRRRGDRTWPGAPPEAHIDGGGASIDLLQDRGRRARRDGHVVSSRVGFPRGCSPSSKPTRENVGRDRARPRGERDPRRGRDRRRPTRRRRRGVSDSGFEPDQFRRLRRSHRSGSAAERRRAGAERRNLPGRATLRAGVDFDRTGKGGDRYPRVLARGPFNRGCAYGPGVCEAASCTTAALCRRPRPCAHAVFSRRASRRRSSGRRGRARRCDDGAPRQQPRARGQSAFHTLAFDGV